MANKKAQALWRARKKAGLIGEIHCNLCEKRLRADSHHTDPSGSLICRACWDLSEEGRRDNAVRQQRHRERN